jgi:hypothetical protein
MRGRRGIRAVTVTLGLAVFTGDDLVSGYGRDTSRGVTVRLLRR